MTPRPRFVARPRRVSDTWVVFDDLRGTPLPQTIPPQWQSSSRAATRRAGASGVNAGGRPSTERADSRGGGARVL